MIKRRWVGALVWLLTLPFTVWAVLRAGGWNPVWQWVPLVAFTPYVAAASAVPLLAALGLRRRAAAVVALATCVTLAAAVLPRHFDDGEQPVADGRLRVLAANLAVGEGDTTSLMKLVRELDPDVLALQELTPAARDRLEKAGLREIMPHAVDRAVDGVWGSGVYAEHPITEKPMIELGRFRQARGVIAHPSGHEIEIVSVHPCAPRYDYKVECWADGLRALPRAGGQLRVLAGDFNATLDHGLVRDLLAGGYRDAADVTGLGLTATWPQEGWEPVPGVTIDHVLADARMAVNTFGVHPLPGTDHRPVFAELGLPRRTSG
ncbi:endonuclease/exonuclease/phosphatase (EEP) superfamily protein YafD [Streptosporangium becharense]|uniref:Endonuclease/exonuclease/phosphatase (EEP) superfamily protein YafD n=1 Tax=Streptosporangium becharense TaxID=1816182 RepID=A0A7W9MJT0_9ACTN|nr:endonuclease/exonuclease/phosphatase family protein [Streptosporangium becharense]MBB2914545.1 endonuclease/exonuclease/phosphatase (EEP) superfamily protein YafD [Streptosporangium becharense]MBB5823390.1 endonuclease/exonuclease/phosphatase (EEP) superfamily protein YafD [Streptosporangium becharense]